MSLLPVDEAQRRLFALGPPLAEETVSLAEVAGRWSARDIVSLRTQPAADLSAMDGYALRFAELPGPLTVVGESRAGRGFDPALAPGQAARIFTGAPLPEGADTILIQEEAARVGDLVRLDGEGPDRVGRHVRRCGSDFQEGDRLIAAGDRLTPPAIALAASGGHGRLVVRRRPRVALISTGDELVPPGAPTPGVMLPSSNAPMLAALLAQLPVELAEHGIVPDDLGLLTAAFGRARDADVIVTTGGASVGDHDLVRPALAAAGAALDFWKVALKPGKPLMAGRLGEAIVLGLPGNPVSAYVTAVLFLLPLLRHLLGACDPLPPQLAARLSSPLPPTGGRAEYLRARSAAEGVAAVSGQDSAALAALVQADALIVRGPHAPAAAAGEMVRIIPLA